MIKHMILECCFATDEAIHRLPARCSNYHAFFKSQAMTMVFSTPLPLAWQWFPARKGLVSGLILAGFGSGSMLFNVLGSKFANPGRFP